jgi:peptide/nickel transport system substrate-binding protein
MRKTSVLAGASILITIGAFAVVTSGTGQAQTTAFAFPAKWTVSKPGDVKTGGTLRYGYRVNAQTFNPFSQQTQAPLLGNEGLVITDPVNANEHIPYMAESYTLSKDKRTFTFKIRKGMKWSDGKPITAEDWATTYKIEIDEDVDSIHYAAYYQDDKPIKVEKLDDYTVRYTFKYASHDNWDIVAYPIIPAHIFGPAYEKRGAAGVKALWGLNTKPDEIVVAGPWKLVSYQPGERITYTRNPAYGEWNKDSAGKPLPYLAGLQLNIVKDSNSELVQYLNGNLDQFTPRNLDDLSQIKKAIDSGNFKAVLKAGYAPGDVTYSMFFNMNRKSDPVKQTLFRNVDFRRAMSHLVNRKAMLDIAWGGLGQIQWTQVPPALGEWVSPNPRKFDYNPEAATALLSKLGYSKKNGEGYLANRDGKVLEFDIGTSASGSITLKMVQIFVEDAKKAGVKVNLKPVDAATIGPLFRSTGDDRKFDAFIWAAGYEIHPWPIVGPYEQCGEDGNVYHYFNNSGKCLFPWETQISALYKRGESEFDDQKRVAIAHQIQNITAEQQSLIFFPGPTRHTSWLSKVRGEFPADKIVGKDGVRRDMLTWIAD